MTYAGTEMTNAMFVAGLLIYWLRELAGFRLDRENAKNMGCCKKMAFNCQGVSSCAIAYLCFLFLALVINFMILNCFYYVYVRGDPSLAGRFSIYNDSTLDVFMIPSIVTLGLLTLYYIQYIFAMLLGCTRLCQDSTTKSRKVSFVIGQIIHFMFILCVFFGVFSRHFANGGI